MSYCVKHATTFHTQTCERCSDESTIARLTAEVERLRASKARMVKEIDAWRSAWRKCDIIAHPDVRKVIDSTISTSLNRINGAQLDVDTNNDLAPAKEDSDG